MDEQRAYNCSPRSSHERRRDAQRPVRHAARPDAGHGLAVQVGVETSYGDNSGTTMLRTLPVSGSAKRHRPLSAFPYPDQDGSRSRGGLDQVQDVQKADGLVTTVAVGAN